MTGGLGPRGAQSTILETDQQKKAQADFLANRTSRRAARKLRNAQKVKLNTDRATRRSAAGEEEPDSEDEYQVPQSPVAGGEVTQTSAPMGDAQAIFMLIKDMEPGSQQLFLSVMMKMKGSDTGAVPGNITPAGTIPERPTAIPRIFNAAAFQPARTRTIDPLSRPGLSNSRQRGYISKVNDEGKTVTIYTLDPSIFEEETTLSHIRFDEAHANYRRWFLENAPPEAIGQLEAYNNHRQRCWDVNLVDERDFLMVQQWCRSWMQCQAWKPTEWDEGIYHKEFEASRAWYFENKVARQMGELEKHSQRQFREPQQDRQGQKSTYPERTSSSSYSDRTTPYPRERTERDQQCSFRKDTQLCLRCGDTGHMAREYQAAKTVKGSPVKVFFESGRIFWVSEPATQVCITWDLRGSCEGKNANPHSHACTLCGTTKHFAASGKC
ncbi:hypothetical protein C8R45DRAFT_939749 [Mycena sanguinolenta]|nr:hypothetical protein C8R45DRAFT_939749 [Mycena sanguinolenta]